MSHKTYVILVLTCLFALQLKAQPLFSEPNFTPDFEKNEPPKMLSDTLLGIQLRISRMSNRMIWLQQKLKEDVSLESTVRQQLVVELSEVIKERGDLMQMTRRMIRTQNCSGKLVLFE